MDHSVADLYSSLLNPNKVLRHNESFLAGRGGGGYSFNVRVKGGHTQTVFSPLRLRFGTSTIFVYIYYKHYFFSLKNYIVQFIYEVSF